MALLAVAQDLCLLQPDVLLAIGVDTAQTSPINMDILLDLAVFERLQIKPVVQPS